MVRTIKRPDRTAVAELLKATLVSDTKSATKALKDFERQYETYPEFAIEDAEMMYRECVQIFRNSDHSILRYNALRLLKYVVTTEDFLRKYAADIWMLYTATIFDPDGNVRQAGFQLLSRYRFGMTLLADPYPFRRKRVGKKRMAEMTFFQRMLIEQCLELFEMEQRYRKEHPGIERKRPASFLPGSWDTKDVYLKNIRRGMEEATRGTFIEKLAEKHRYELPRHWLFEGQLQEQENEWPPGTEGDIAGVLIDPKGNMLMTISDPPNPKSFSSFEEYQEALAMRDVFLEKAKAVDDILSSTDSEEEIDVAMEVLGFQKHDDAPCNRKWCVARYGCVAMTLIDMLQEIENSFFKGSLVPKHQLLSQEEMERCALLDCHALPREWFVEKTRQYGVFRWFMNLMDALSWNERRVPFASLSEDAIESAFVREAYFFALSELRGYSWKQEHEGKGLIQGFLKKNDIVRLDDAMSLLNEFERLLLL